MLSCYCYMLWFIRVDDGDGTFPRNFDLHSDATEEAICQQQIQEHKEELVNNLPSPSWLTTQFYCTDTFFFFFPVCCLSLHIHYSPQIFVTVRRQAKKNGLWSSSGVISSGAHHTTSVSVDFVPFICGFTKLDQLYIQCISISPPPTHWKNWLTTEKHTKSSCRKHKNGLQMDANLS